LKKIIVERIIDTFHQLGLHILFSDIWYVCGDPRERRRGQQTGKKGFCGCFFGAKR
jgi:hypothetical protein